MQKFKSSYLVGHKYWKNPEPKQNSKASYLNPAERQRYADKLIERLSEIYTTDAEFSLHEFGCGWGYNLNAIKSKFPNIKISGNDIWDDALNYLSHETHDIIKCDTYDYIKHCIADSKKFDVVISNAHIIHLDESKFSEFIDLGKITTYAILQESIYDIDKLITSMSCTQKNNINLPDCDIQYFLVSNA